MPPLLRPHLLLHACLLSSVLSVLVLSQNLLPLFPICALYVSGHLYSPRLCSLSDVGSRALSSPLHKLSRSTLLALISQLQRSATP
ncbi:hypothetical protein CRG98_002289 [Punica granatum]|uniref:Secreted protein n=1 Tax=Punica granatum TaxID=22663 RepID=A0A2I0L9H8_PUNGR|nr:hypothetical protein CRG98_002289 [Punica granatum]